MLSSFHPLPLSQSNCTVRTICSRTYLYFIIPEVFTLSLICSRVYYTIFIAVLVCTRCRLLRISLEEGAVVPNTAGTREFRPLSRREKKNPRGTRGKKATKMDKSFTFLFVERVLYQEPVHTKQTKRERNALRSYQIADRGYNTYSPMALPASYSIPPRTNVSSKESSRLHYYKRINIYIYKYKIGVGA